MKRPHEMTFKEFTDAVKASAGMNRWPQLGQAHDMVSYSVYMNGEVAEMLPQSVREHEYRDVALHALTEKLGLDPLSMRDNLKVAEVVAIRHAYMTSVLEASLAYRLSPEVEEDYVLLADQMSHPIIQKAIEDQKLLSNLLTPVLADAEKALGQPVKEQLAAGVSRGEIISQNAEFTVQDLGDGRIVAHENRRLQDVPAIGKDVTVTYYRGKGQVIENIQDLTVGQAYVDEKSGDLAVNLSNVGGEVQRVVLFNSMAMIAEFATEHNLGKDFVRNAMDVRDAMPKKAPERAAREVVGEPYRDLETAMLAIDYRESGLKYTALFSSADDLKQQSKVLGISNEMVSKAYQIERLDDARLVATTQKSQAVAEEVATSLGMTLQTTNRQSGRYAGVVKLTTDLHVVQDVGRGTAVIHDKRDLDKVPLPGEKISLAYKAGRAEVTVREPSKERGGR